MLFNSVQYLVFLPIIFLLYWWSPGRLRTVILLAASYYFYMSWMKSYGLLLFGLTLTNYIFGLLIAHLPSEKLKRLGLIAGITANLGCLGIFKYTNFFLDAYKQLTCFLQSTLHLAVPDSKIADLPIILPLGISFFVFEFIHYLVDVRGGSTPIRAPLRFGLFAAFFPSQIAGPIKRFQDFDQQVVLGQRFHPSFVQDGLWLIVRGMFKKVALGDNLAPIVQVGFHTPQLMGTLDAWLCVLAFTFQIYFDFSGYTDIGRGSALLFGYKLPENFNMPYVAASIREFWHRWHISLSTWLRDYLYIPLGGSRKDSQFTTIRNLMVTMLLGGLWHGASWHFVVWGGFQGAGLTIHRLWEHGIDRVPALKCFKNNRGSSILAIAVTFLTVCIGWVLFRAANLTEAMNVYQAMFSWRPSLLPNESILTIILQSTLPVGLSIYAFGVLLNLIWSRRATWVAATALADQLSKRFWLTPPLAARIVALAAATFLIIGLAPQQSAPFIYFQF